MIVNKSDWLRFLNMAASVGNPAVKFAPDGTFGVMSGQGFAVFGKSLSLNQYVALADIGGVIKNVKCVSRLEVNVEISDGVMTIGDGESVYYCLLTLPELVASYQYDEFSIASSEDWFGMVVAIEKLHELEKKVKATKSGVVWFFANNGRVTALSGSPGNLWRVDLGLGCLPRPFLVTAEKLLSVINIVDVSTVLLSFKFSEPSALRVMQDYRGDKVVWFIAERKDKSGWQTYQQSGLLLPFQG